MAENDFVAVAIVNDASETDGVVVIGNVVVVDVLQPDVVVRVHVGVLDVHALFHVHGVLSFVLFLILMMIEAQELVPDDVRGLLKIAELIFSNLISSWKTTSHNGHIVVYSNRNIHQR